MNKLTRTQFMCIKKSMIFEKANKEVLQSKIDAYKCLKGFKVTYATKNKVILLKPIDDGTFHKVIVKIDFT